LQTAKDKKDKLTGFLGSMFSSGMQTAIVMQSKVTIANKNMKKIMYGKLMESKKESQNQYKDADIENTFFESAALNICKQGPSAISAKDREEFGRILGTDTIVQ